MERGTSEQRGVCVCVRACVCVCRSRLCGTACGTGERGRERRWHLEGGQGHGGAEADERVDGEEEALLLVGPGEEHRHPQVHGRQGQPVGPAQVLHCTHAHTHKMNE